MPGRSAKRKGGRVEREIVKMHEHIGIQAKRVPLSGAAEGFPGDVLIGRGNYLRAEVKSRKNPPKTMLRWLAKNDLLFIKPDREPPVVVMTWDMYMQFVTLYYGRQPK